MVRAADQRAVAHPRRWTRPGPAAAALVAAGLITVAASGCSAAKTDNAGLRGLPDGGSASSVTSGAAPNSSAAASAAKSSAAKASASVAKAAASAAAAARAASAAAAAASAASKAAASAQPPRTSVVVAVPVAHASSAPAGGSSEEPSLESAVFTLLNQERAENGLPALQASGALDISARRHSSAMAASGTLDHVLPGEAEVPQREAAAGYRGSGWAENIGETGQSDRAGALALEDLLYSDPPHRANILNPSMHAVGVGIVVDSGGRLWLTEDFGA